MGLTAGHRVGSNNKSLLCLAAVFVVLEDFVGILAGEGLLLIAAAAEEMDEVVVN